MSEPISVNPQVLRWARTSLGLSQEEVAQRMNKKARDIDDRVIEDWASLYCVSRETILRRLLDQGQNHTESPA